MRSHDLVERSAAGFGTQPMGEMGLPGCSDLRAALVLRRVPNELRIDEVTRDCRLLMYLSRLNASFGK
ncbi:uncharacterized [Tachysurus ichikawai]